MEELITLIIQLIAGLFDGKNKIAQPPPPPQSTRKGAQPPDIDMYQSVQQALGGAPRRPPSGSAQGRQPGAVPTQRRNQGVRTNQAGTVGNRVGLKRGAQVPIRRQAMVNMKRQPSRPPPLNRVVAAPQRVPQHRVAPSTGQVQRTVATTNAPAHPVSPINADSVRKLMRNKSSALRTIYVLTELMGKPIGLRED